MILYLMRSVDELFVSRCQKGGKHKASFEHVSALGVKFANMNSAMAFKLGGLLYSWTIQQIPICQFDVLWNILDRSTAPGVITSERTFFFFW